MKKIIVLLSFLLAGYIGQAQTLGFPSLDSLSRYNNRYINNSPVEAFANLRLNTLLHGVIWWIDTAINRISDTSGVTIPKNHNGKGKPGTIRYNDTLYVFQVSKDTIWTSVLLEAVNGVHKIADSVMLGGALIEATDIDQDGNGITFHDGLFTHGTGNYLTETGAFSVLTHASTYYNNRMQAVSGADSYYGNIEMGVGSGESSTYINMGVNNPTSDVLIDMRPDKLELQTGINGNLRILDLIDSAQAYELNINPTNWKVTYALKGGGGGGGGGSTVYATNGLTNINDSTVAFGGTLTSNRTITAAAYTTTWAGAFSGTGQSVFTVSNTGSGTALGATNNGAEATGSFTNSGSGNAVLATGTSGIPLRAVTTSGSAAGTFQVNPSTTSTVVNVLELNRVTSGTAGASMGGAVRFNLEAADGSFYLSNRLISRWADPAAATRTSTFQIEGVNAGTTATIFSLLGDGQLALNNYGDGLFVGGVTYGLGVDANGNLKEYTVSGGGGGTVEMDDAYFNGDGTTGSPYTPDITVIALQTDIDDLHTRVDSIINNWPSGGAGGKTVLQNATGTGDTLSVKVNDSLYTIKKLIAGTNTTFTVGANSITINGSSGAAEVNTQAFTTSVTADRTISAEAILQYVLVRPATSLTGFKVGTAADDDKYVTATPVTAGAEYVVFSVEAHIPTSTAVRFSGITSSTEIKLVYKTLHQ